MDTYKDPKLIKESSKSTITSASKKITTSTVKTNLELDERIKELLKYEETRYKTKGYGLILAIVICLFYFLFAPKLISHVLYSNNNKESLINKNPGIYFYISLFVLHLATLIIINLVFITIYKLNIPFFERYKTSHNSWPWEEDYNQWIELLKKTFKYLLVNQFIMFPLSLSPHLIYDYCPYNLDEASSPNLFEILYQIFFFMIVEDFSFYLSHRLLHHKSIYSKVHKIHHNYKQVVSISAEFCHPFEYIFSNLIPSAIGPMILGSRVHIITYFLWVILRICETAEGH